MTWHIDGSAPLYLQLADNLRHAIIGGEYPAGVRIASVRELAADAKVNPNTMQRALFELEREGLIETHGTTGKYVTDDADILTRTREAALDGIISDFLKSLGTLGYGIDEAIVHIKERSDIK